MLLIFPVSTISLRAAMSTLRRFSSTDVVERTALASDSLSVIMVIGGGVILSISAIWDDSRRHASLASAAAKVSAAIVERATLLSLLLCQVIRFAVPSSSTMNTR